MWKPIFLTGKRSQVAKDSALWFDLGVQENILFGVHHRHRAHSAGVMSLTCGNALNIHRHVSWSHGEQAMNEL